MSDILDPTGDGATTAPVSLNDLVNVTPLTNAAPPLAAQRNQAAKVSLLADGPDSATDRYQKIMSESTQGSTDTITSDTQRIQDQTAASDTATTMNILANPNIPMEQKQAVVDNFNKAPILKDTGMIVHSNLLAKPSAGETPDAENARLTVADSFSQIYQAQAFRQGIINQAKEDDDKTSPATHFWNAASQLIPFSAGLTNDKILSDVAAHTGIKQDWWQHFDQLYRGGRPIAEMRDMVNSLPPEQQMAFASSVRDAVKNKSGLLWGTDNQAVAYSKINDILGTGTYGNGSEFLDNTFSLLDTLGAGGVVHAGNAVVQAGKRLLSGGEKAMTAIALVFSIFQLNPSPFCMLDEVDAPLDDANVGRYAALVREMSEVVQFIFITHNRLTMESAKQLLGVTMHEPGVSRLVAVDIDEAAELAAM